MIKRFNPDFSLSISHELAYMRETPEGGYVAHCNYATLFSELEVVKAERDAQQKRADALAVENAAMRAAFDDIAETMETGTDGMLFTAVDNAVNLEVTHTDAALAAIQAQGVEKFAQRMQEKMEGLDPIKLPAYAEEIDHLISELYAFAAELREAK
ncbi:TPA: hypothetical protein ACKPW5_003094 [Serratia marcescens]